MHDIDQSPALTNNIEVFGWIYIWWAIKYYSEKEKWNDRQQYYRIVYLNQNKSLRNVSFFRWSVYILFTSDREWADEMRIFIIHSLSFWRYTNYLRPMCSCECMLEPVPVHGDQSYFCYSVLQQHLVALKCSSSHILLHFPQNLIWSIWAVWVWNDPLFNTF